MNSLRLLFSLIMALVTLALFGCSKAPSDIPLTLQLNWLHDPTFAGEYLASQRSDLAVTIKEGGPNITPIAEVLSGRANIAIVGADVFIQALQKDASEGKKSELVCIFVDFQRNPVGWVLHPDAAAKAGLSTKATSDPRELNKWLFGQFAAGALKPGDKRGTETTSVWIQWRKVHGLQNSVSVVPVGFDTAIVLSAPALAYPVYLNEEPFKLSEKIGKDIVVFDPAADGIELYGNVLVTTRKFSRENLKAIRLFQAALRRGWESAKTDKTAAATLVSKYYKGVSDKVRISQIDKTLEFVFYGNRQPGTMDMTSDGRWAKTLKALQDAELVKPALTLDLLKDHLLPPE